MRDIFKSRFFILSLIIAAVLTAASITMDLLGYSSITAQIISYTIYPFRSFAILVSDSINGFIDYFTTFDEIRAENLELKKIISDLRIELSEVEKLQKENDMLYRYYNLQRDHTDFIMQNAEVIARESANYMSFLVINKGSFHGIEHNHSVITEEGIIGFVYETGQFTSKVALLTRTGTSIAARIIRTEDSGIIEGDFEYERDGLCRMIYISKESDVKIGDLIESSGTGGKYPEGLMIGEVIDIIPDPYTQTLTAIVKPSADLYDISTVMVIKSFERTFN